ncbi:UDP-2,4-diacetamido-2,4,6-trideoxy-beta-L-altropyranose hydrolase [compost metagenome]
MRVFIRADASEVIGTGHVVRCLTLADELIKHTKEIVFIYRQMPDHLVACIKNKGFSLLKCSFNYKVGSIEDAQDTALLIQSQYKITIEDWLIVDHYSIDHVWESIIEKMIKNLMVIDDLANRKHECKLLLDTSLCDHPEHRYFGLVSPSTKQLLGPKYALLRDEFIKVRSHMTSRTYNSMNNINILVCFGGTDPTNETWKVINSLTPLVINDNKYEITVILGQANPNIQNIQENCNTLESIKVLVQPPSMALEMFKADIAICGGGTMTWERYCMGLPALVIAIAANQIGIAEQGEKWKLDKYLGESKFVSDELIRNELEVALRSPQKLKSSSYIAMELVDGKGATRIADILIGRCALGD